jgi:transcriptional antiterminator NusG
MARSAGTFSFHPGDRVRILNGPFAGMEGKVITVYVAKGTVSVLLEVLGRPVPVELEAWEIEFV